MIIACSTHVLEIGVCVYTHGNNVFCGTVVKCMHLFKINNEIVYHFVDVDYVS